MDVKNRNKAQCSECKGAPREHNVRDAKIVVNGREYPQHSFQFSGN